MGKLDFAMNGGKDLNNECSQQESVTESAQDDLITVKTDNPSCNSIMRPHQMKRPRQSASPVKCKSLGACSLEENVPLIKDNFDILFKIGEGTFSSVYKAALKGYPETMVALKHLVPTSSSARIENEIKFLQITGGKDNVISLSSCIRFKDHVVLVMPYFPHDRFSEYLHSLSVQEVQLYMSALFLALRNVHSHHIIHRDIKPSNFLYNRSKKTFQLVDFGLAHLEPSYAKQQSESKSHARLTRSSGGGSSTIEGKRRLSKEGGCPLKHSNKEICIHCLSRSNQTAPRAGTPGFRAPEVLLKHPVQSTSVDIWSAGVILLSMLSGCYPFFRAYDDRSAMAQIISVMGSKECSQAARTFGKELIIVPDTPSVDLKTLCESLRASSNSSNTSKPSKKPRLSNGRTTMALKGTNTTETAIEMMSLVKLPREERNKHNKDKPSTTGNCEAYNGLGTVPDCAYDLLQHCLDLNPVTRITAEQALSHSFIVNR